MSLTFVEANDCKCCSIRGPDFGQVLERQPWFLIRPGQCRLGHEHVGLRVIGMDFEERAEPSLDLVELATGQAAAASPRGSAPGGRSEQPPAGFRRR